MKWYNVNVNANFGGYACCVRWHSASAGAPAQYNNVYGLNMSYCDIGLLFGQEIGSPSVDAPQSENTVHGLTCRGLKTPFVGNQSNGFITLVSPIVDCNPYEWSLQPGYNAATFNTAALTFNNVVGQVVVVGGEVLKTATQLGYGIRGKELMFLGTVFEIACAQAYVTGNILIRDSTNGYIASDSASAFTIASGATGVLCLANITTSRGPGVGSYSGVTFIGYESSTSATNVIIEGGNILEWRVETITGRTVSFNNVRVTQATGAKALTVSDNSNCLLREKGVDTSIYSLTNWFYTLVYGGGSSMAIGVAAPTGKTASSLELVATGIAYASAGDVTSAATIKSTGIRVGAGEYWKLEAWAKATDGNCAIRVVFYNLAGVPINTVSLSPILTTAWVRYSLYTNAVALTAGYMIVELYGQTGTANMTDIMLTRVVKPQ